WSGPATAMSRLGSSGPRSEGAHHGDPARIAAALERAVPVELPAALPRQRWFGAKGRAISGTRLLDCGELGDRAWLVLADVTFAQGPDETYAIPLVLDAASAATSTLSLTLDVDGATRAADAFDHREFCLELLTAFERRSVLPTVRGGSVRFASPIASRRSVPPSRSPPAG